MKLPSETTPHSDHEHVLTVKKTGSLIKEQENKLPKNSVNPKTRKSKGSVCHFRTIQSLNHSKNSIYEALYTNAHEFTYFVHFTASPRKHDRYSVTWITSNVRGFLNKKKKKYGDFPFLVVPERHLNGAFHAHGVMGDAVASELIPLEYEEATEKERKEMDDGKECFIWPEYEELFGRIRISKIDNIKEVAEYLTKFFKPKLRNRLAPFNTPSFFTSYKLPRNDWKVTCKLKEGELSSTSLLVDGTVRDYKKTYCAGSSYPECAEEMIKENLNNLIKSGKAEFKSGDASVLKPVSE